MNIYASFTPVRCDGVTGKLLLSEPTDKILPEIPKIQALHIQGEAIEGETLVVTEEIPREERQQYVWEKFVKEVKYCWARSSAPHNNESFEALRFQRSCLYNIRTEDIGHFLHCECTVIDVFGRLSLPMSVISPAVSPGEPKVQKLEIEGCGYHSDIFAIRGIYSGGKEGKSVIQWFRAMARSFELLPIEGEMGRMYEANVEDVGYRLVAVYTPIRDDGKEGTPVSASTDPIRVEPALAKEVAEKLEQGSFKFEALLNRDPFSPTKVNQGLGQFEKRLIEINKKRIKAIKPGSKAFLGSDIRCSLPFHVEADKRNRHLLKIVMDDGCIQLMVSSRYMRDLIVLVMKGLNSQSN
ncbi:hypothetical protein KP509_18G073300 [Ceratopteris richardii]|uniref:Uncharacterized protein n=1 Tax=Ceratopteris richardii TaxID=49495 RepID=A0A8T2SQY7_CERRI|nr:hypothetical protein KP509_18G073300 [Ceratopteris richardii]